LADLDSLYDLIAAYHIQDSNVNGMRENGEPDAPQNGGVPNGGNDVSPGQQAPVQPMEIKFRDNRGFELTIKLKPTTPMYKAMNAFSAKIERDRKSLRFLIEGKRVVDDDTPASVSLSAHVARECTY